MGVPFSKFRIQRHCVVSLVATSFTAVLIIWSLSSSVSIAQAGYLPETPEEFVAKTKNFAKAKLRPLMAGLYNWFGVDDVIRPGIESGIDSILTKEILKIELTDVPKGFPIQFERAGVVYERNVALEHAVKFTLVNDAGKTVVKYLPFGKTPEGYAFAASVPSKDLAKALIPATPEPVVAPVAASVSTTVDNTKRKVPSLGVIIEAPDGVVSEIACAYFDSVTGERKVMTWRAEGGLEDSVDGSAFDTCAAKKRSGSGVLKLVLEQAGSAVYAKSTDQVDKALVYRSQ